MFKILSLRNFDSVKVCSKDFHMEMLAICKFAQKTKKFWLCESLLKILSLNFFWARTSLHKILSFRNFDYVKVWLLIRLFHKLGHLAHELVCMQASKVFCRSKLLNSDFLSNIPQWNPLDGHCPPSYLDISKYVQLTTEHFSDVCIKELSSVHISRIHVITLGVSIDPHPP